jgi:chitin synthase
MEQRLIRFPKFRGARQEATWPLAMGMTAEVLRATVKPKKMSRQVPGTNDLVTPVIHRKILAAMQMAYGTGFTTNTTSRTSAFGSLMFESNAHGALAVQLIMDEKHRVNGGVVLDYGYIPTESLAGQLAPRVMRWMHMGGGSVAQRKSWGLYAVASTADQIRAANEALGEWIHSLQTLGLSDSSLNAILNIFAAAEHISVLQFVDAVSATKVADGSLSSMDHASRLLGLEAQELVNYLVSESRLVANGQFVTLELDPQQSRENALNFAHALCALITRWLFDFSNSRISPKSLDSKQNDSNSLPHVSIAIVALSDGNSDSGNANINKNLTQRLDAWIQTALRNSRAAIDADNGYFVTSGQKDLDLSLFDQECVLFPISLSNLLRESSNSVAREVISLSTRISEHDQQQLGVPNWPARCPISTTSAMVQGQEKIARKPGKGPKGVMKSFAVLLEQTLTRSFPHFISCGWLLSGNQVILEASKDKHLCTYAVQIPLVRFLKRYKGLITSHVPENMVPAASVGVLAKAIGFDNSMDFIVKGNHLWLSPRGLRIVESALAVFREWKTNAAITSPAEMSFYVPGKSSYAPNDWFSDTGSVQDMDDDYFSESASVVDGFNSGRSEYAGSVYRGNAPAIYDSGKPSNMKNLPLDKSGIELPSFQPYKEKRVSDTDEVKKRATAPARKRWLVLVWFMTWWIPSCLLNCTLSRDRQIQMAWREKVTIFVLILIFSAFTLTAIVFAPWIVCPPRKLFSMSDLGNLSSDVKTSTVFKKLYVAIRGKVYNLVDFANFFPVNHKAADMTYLVGEDLSSGFPRSTADYCGAVMTRAGQKPRDLDVPIGTLSAQGPGIKALHSKKLNDSAFQGRLESYLYDYPRGTLAFSEAEIKSAMDPPANTNLPQKFVVVKESVYDLTRYISLPNAGDHFLRNIKFKNDKDEYDVEQYMLLRSVSANSGDYSLGGLDISSDAAFMSQVWNADGNAMQNCFNAVFKIGVLDPRQSLKCRFADYTLFAMSMTLCAIIGVKFLAALIHPRFSYIPEAMDKFVIMQVPCYTEDEESMRRTLHSLATLNYDDKRKLLIVLCDGMIVGRGNDRTTPQIVLDVLGVDPILSQQNPPVAFEYDAIGEVPSLRRNRAQVYSGLYEVEGRLVPYIVIAKCGMPGETNRPGNRGKRDSQMLLMRFLNRLHMNRDLSPLEMELRYQIECIIGQDPKWFEFMLMVDADTTVAPDSLSQLVSFCMTDTDLIGVTGETKVTNEKVAFNFTRLMRL